MLHGLDDAFTLPLGIDTDPASAVLLSLDNKNNFC
jgi:hypothetical protein